MRRISFLPSLLTVGNFTCGFISIILCLQTIRLYGIAKFAAEPLPITDRAAELFGYACAFVFMGMIFDVFDGRVARMTGAVSKF
ncbi:MAG: CDP-alcohol phosphatidyltransferase family protein, partial [Planctomycetes bacterium]|nr:CDP-alcohol phosphatidyltransferase family protein [Planctomycetota bacterium]